MTRQPLFKSNKELLRELDKQIKEWEKRFQCSTETMKIQYRRNTQNKSLELIAWYRLAEMRDQLTERLKCDSKL